MPNLTEQMELLTDGVGELIEPGELQSRLAAGRPLRVKLGIDTTAPVITLGHAVVLRRLALFQKLGHQAIFLIGDETARVGDPTGRSDARRALSEEEVRSSAEAFIDQVGAILDRDSLEIRFNSEWLRQLGFTGALELASRYTVARMLEREDFHKRFVENRPIHLHEMLYPLMQGYDSVALRADVELGATEQKFNLLVGRQLQREHGMEPQVVMMLPILTGLDGEQKMSKSLGNYIGINDAADDMFGKLMSIPDGSIGEYLLLAADVGRREVTRVEAEMAAGRLNPRDAKAEMARRVVAIYHGQAAAKSAEERFDRTFRERSVPSDAPVFHLTAARDMRLCAVLTQAAICPSISAGRRLVQEGGVRLGEQKLTDPDQPASTLIGETLRVGRHRFLRIEA